MGRTETELTLLELIIKDIGPSLQPARAVQNSRVLGGKQTFSGLLGRLLEVTYGARRTRSEIFGDQSLFGEPAWDIMLELAMAQMRDQRLSMSELCSALPIPVNTSLRWINEMAAQGYLTRQNVTTGVQANVYVELSESSQAMLLGYLELIQSRYSAREVLAG